AGQIHCADSLARDRVLDRYAGARQVLEILRVVLVAEHMHRLAAFERRADAIGAYELLCIAEAGSELHHVEMTRQGGVPCEPGKDEPSLVGEPDADRLAGPPLEQLTQHRFRAAAQWGLKVRIMDVRHLDAVRSNVAFTGSPPRGEDGLAHSTPLAPAAGW